MFVVRLKDASCSFSLGSDNSSHSWSTIDKNDELMTELVSKNKAKQSTRERRVSKRAEQEKTGNAGRDAVASGTVSLLRKTGFVEENR